MQHESLYKLALQNIQGHRCANCSEYDLKIKRFNAIAPYEAEVVYACPNCTEIEFKENITDDDYFSD